MRNQQPIGIPMFNTISPASSSNPGATIAYVTRKQHQRMVRTACVAILTTSGGAATSHSSIAAQVGCAISTVARIKRELREIGLLGAVPSAAPGVQRVPDATFDSLFSSISDLLGWLCDLRTEETPAINVAEAISEARDLLRTIRHDGALPLHLALIVQRLDALEATCQYIALVRQGTPNPVDLEIAAIQSKLAELAARLAALS
jgi:hypothetical protein